MAPRLMHRRWSGIVPTMKISLEEVRRVAALAHLELDAATDERLRSHLDQILAYMDQLNRLDTADVTPALGVTEEGKTYRDDCRSSGLTADEALANAPDAGAGHFKVPRVMSP